MSGKMQFHLAMTGTCRKAPIALKRAQILPYAKKIINF